MYPKNWRQYQPLISTHRKRLTQGSLDAPLPETSTLILVMPTVQHTSDSRCVVEVGIAVLTKLVKVHKD